MKIYLSNPLKAEGSPEECAIFVTIMNELGKRIRRNPEILKMREKDEQKIWDALAATIQEKIDAAAEATTEVKDGDQEQR